MRRFLVRLTLLSAAVAACLAAVIGVANRAPWPLVMTRAAIAFLIVTAIGVVASFILMRTALRRYYEQSRPGTPLDRARAGR
ncbi:MAG TPA: hypothetical protein VFM17_09205 [Candidatus Eisenbacteria bacterium]|nr:hypothetical protein [Candidatus Eisenbacteria bacterium]